jgi:hypothetical protein
MFRHRQRICPHHRHHRHHHHRRRHHRASSLCATTGMIQTQALRILSNGTFSASNGWFDRIRLTIRRITTSHGRSWTVI